MTRARHATAVKLEQPNDAEAAFSSRLQWTQTHMPRTLRAVDRLPPLEGVRLACSLHLDIKMAPALTALVQRGAELFLTTCNPTTVRDDVVRHLQQCGATVRARAGMGSEEIESAIGAALAWGPTHLCEMGADLTTAHHRSRSPSAPIVAGLEATGSGIARLGAVTPRYPIFNWDDLPVKEGLHNRHMVGLTTWHAFFAKTHLTLHGKRVLVIGFGLVGRGLCDAARAYGGCVMVAEQDPARAQEAAYAGWHTVPLEEGLAAADVVVTATGARSVIRSEHLELLRDGVFLLNAGHVADEIDIRALHNHPTTDVIPFVQRTLLPGKTPRRIYLFAGGSMANLTAGEGDSVNAFDITLAVMIAGVGHIVGAGAKAPPGVHLLPRSAWQEALRD